MANTDTIAVLYQRELNRKLSDKPKMPFSRIANFKYEGELKNGWDTVTVSISPKIVMTDESSKNSGNIRKTSLSDIEASDRNIGTDTLRVDKLHRYLEEYATLEEIQTAYNIGSERMKDMIVAINTVCEKGIIQTIDAMILANSSTNKLTASAKLTKDNIATEVMRLRTELSKKEVPFEGRVLIVSPDISGLIALAGILSGTEDAAKSAIAGRLGRFAGFEVYESNLIDPGKLYAIHSGAVNYVRQHTEADITKKEKAFGFNLKGQVVHGGKVFSNNIERIFVMEDVQTPTPTPTETETETETETA